MQPHAGEDERRDEKDVDGERTGERRPTDGRAAQDEMGEPVSEGGNASRLFRCDDRGPDPILIPAQQLTRKRHEYGQQEQRGPGQPIHLARELVRSGEKHARHVGSDEHHHRARSEVMHPAEDTAKWCIVRNELQALVRAARRGDVDRRQRDAGRDLQQERDEGRPAQHVSPVGARGDRMLGQAPADGPQAGPVFEPVSDRADQSSQAGEHWS